MKRLGYQPANPDSTTYDSLADFDVPMYELDARTIPSVLGEPHNVADDEPTISRTPHA